jgi:chromosomal replication initiation ATPase DnaA
MAKLGGSGSELTAALAAARRLVDELERLVRTSGVKQGSSSAVVSVVALALDSTTAEVRGGRRHKKCVRARHACALALRSCELSFSDIALAINVADHTTVISAVASAQRRVERDPLFAAAVAQGVAAWSTSASSD